MREKPFVARHRQIFEELRRKITSGEYPNGAKLPTGQELCKIYSVSRITIAAVFEHLREAGLIRSVRHAGSFVCYEPEDDYFRTILPHRKKTEIIHSLLMPTPAGLHIMELIANIFMQHNPEISIRFRELRPPGSKDIYWELRKSGDLPTCGEFFWHALYAKYNMLCPLEDLPGFQKLLNSLHTQFVYETENSRAENHIHALPLFLGVPICMTLNLDICRKAEIEPKTPRKWSDLLKIAKALGENRRFGYYYSAALTMPQAFHGVKPWVEMLGQDLFVRGGQCTNRQLFQEIFGSPGALEALKNLESLMTHSRIRFKKGTEYFALGDTALLPFTTNWALSLIRMITPDMNKLIFPPPPVGTNHLYRSIVSSFGVGLFQQGIKSEEQKEAAWKWIRFLFHPQPQYLLSQEYRLPARRDTRIYLAETDPELYKLCLQVLKNGVPQPDFVGMRQYFAVAGRYLSQFLHRRLGPEECLRQIGEELSR